MFTTFLEVGRYICAFKFYLSTIIITNQHKTMNKSVLTSSWKGMRRQTLEQNQEWRFIRRHICTYIVTTTCLWRYIVIKKNQRMKVIKKKCICCKRIQLGFFFYSTIKFIRIKLQCFLTSQRTVNVIEKQGLFICMLCKMTQHAINVLLDKLRTLLKPIVFVVIQ